MTLETLLQNPTDLRTLDELKAIAADQKSYGNDLIDAFKAQVALRFDQAKAILDAATTASRDLLASEKRQFDAIDRERDVIVGLQGQVEQRTKANAYTPPASAALHTDATTADAEPMIVVPKGTTMRSWLQRTNPGAKPLSFGRVVGAWLARDRSKLNLNADERRALEEGTDAHGGFTVQPVLMAGFIDALRNAAVCLKAGATIVPMSTETVSIARLAAVTDNASPSQPATPSWKAENADISEASLSLERVTFQAHTLPMLLSMSVELFEDSQNISTIVESAFTKAIALELDRACFLGSGSNDEPKGIVHQSGVTVSDLGSPNAFNYDTLLDMIGDVRGNNVEPNARIYGSDAATVLAKLKALLTGAYLNPPADVAALPAFITNSLSAGQVGEGSPTDVLAVVGDFSQLLIGMRTAFRLEASRVAGNAFGKLQVQVRAYLRADVQLQHGEAFSVRTGTV